MYSDVHDLQYGPQTLGRDLMIDFGLQVLLLMVQYISHSQPLQLPCCDV